MWSVVWFYCSSMAPNCGKAASCAWAFVNAQAGRRIVELLFKCVIPTAFVVFRAITNRGSLQDLFCRRDTGASLWPKAYLSPQATVVPGAAASFERSDLSS